MHLRWAAVVMLLAYPGLARSAPPRLATIYPPAAQKGADNTWKVFGQNFDAAPELILPFAAEVVVEGGGGDAFNVHVKPASSVLPGVYPIRVRTAEGISNLRLVVVSEVPIFRVSNTNGRYKNGKLDPASTERIELPCLIAGHRLERDIEGFQFAAQTGDRLTFVTETWRVGLTPDPLLRLRDGRGRMITYEHDTPSLQRDERVDFTYRESGDNFLEIQSTGGGGWTNHYLVLIGKFDYVRRVFPLGGRRGEQVRFQVVNRDDQTSMVEATIPTDPWSDHWRLPLPQYPASLPWTMASGEHPELIEELALTEPQSIVWPATVNGCIAKPGEQDLYRIAVEPGQTIRVRVDAFHFGSALDGFLLIYDPVGKKLLAKHDDQGYRGHPDPHVDFEVPPGMKEVMIALRDTLNEGSESHSYRLTVEKGGPDFLLWLGNKQGPTNEEDVGWHRMDASDTLNLPVGQPAKLKLSVRRSAKDDDAHYTGSVQGYTGPITVTAMNLPSGVSAQPLVIPAGKTEGELVFEADQSAPRQPFEIVVIGEGIRPDGSLIRRAAERRMYLSDPAVTHMPWNWRVQKVTCVTAATPATSSTSKP